MEEVLTAMGSAREVFKELLYGAFIAFAILHVVGWVKIKATVVRHK